MPQAESFCQQLELGPLFWDVPLHHSLELVVPEQVESATYMGATSSPKRNDMRCQNSKRSTVIYGCFSAGIQELHWFLSWALWLERVEVCDACDVRSAQQHCRGCHQLLRTPLDRVSRRTRCVLQPRATPLNHCVREQHVIFARMRCTNQNGWVAMVFCGMARKCCIMNCKVWARSSLACGMCFT